MVAFLRPLIGTTAAIPEFPYGDGALRGRALCWYEGSLVALHRVADGRGVIYHWADTDQRAHRWLVYGLEPADEAALLAGALPYREAIVRALARGDLYVVDIGPDDSPRVAARVVDLDAVADYLPEPGATYEPDSDA